MVDSSPYMRAWKVLSIEALPESRTVVVSFTIPGGPPVQFPARQFDFGKRSSKVAALARFAAKAGFGPVEDVFLYLSGIPQDMAGDLFPHGPVGLGLSLDADDCLPEPWQRLRA